MKHFRLSILAAVLLLASSCDRLSKHSSPEELMQKAAQSPNMDAGAGKFSIDRPAGWQKIDTLLNGIHVTLLLGSPGNSNFRPNMSVVTESMHGLSLDSYFDQSLATLGQYLQNFSAGPKGEKDINGIHAKWMQYAHHQNGYDIDVLVYVIPKDGIAYLITCSAPKGQLGQSQAEFDSAVASFHIS
jgi:hypothetical protein